MPVPFLTRVSLDVPSWLMPVKVPAAVRVLLPMEMAATGGRGVSCVGGAGAGAVDVERGGLAKRGDVARHTDRAKKVGRRTGGLQDAFVDRQVAGEGVGCAEHHRARAGLGERKDVRAGIGNRR